VELALRLASALRLFWEVRGHFSEGGRWLDEALTRADDVDPAVRLRALSASGTIAFRLGNVALSQERWEPALEIARELGDDLWIARLLSDLGTAAAGREDYDTAVPLLEESAALFRDLDVPSRLGTVLGNLGHIAAERGDYARAIDVTEEVLTLESSHKQNAAISTYNLGSHNLHAGNLEQAREWLERAIALTLELGYKEVMAYALASYVQLCLLEGDATRAAHLAGIADRLLSEAGVLLQPVEQQRFDKTKARTEEELGDGYAPTHDAAMSAPLEEALRQGSVLAGAPAAP
jgi:tetratricopeptide (TPR) repeat protein